MKNILLFILVEMMAISLSAQSPTPFACTGSDGFGYYTSSASSNQSGSTLTYSSSRISKLATSTGVRTTLCNAASIGVALNAMAFNPHDNYLYAMSRYDGIQFSGKLYRIGENCQKLEIPVLGPVVKFNTNNINTIDAAGGNLSSGTFDLDNNYYVNTSFTNSSSTGFTNKLQKIEITNNTATVVSTVTMTCPSCTGANRLRVTDIIFDEASGNLLGSNKETNKLYSINADSGVLTEIGNTGITSPILGIYKNRDGNVRAINEVGNIYAVNLSTGAFTFLATSSTLNSGNADAASGCYSPPKISGYLYIDANGLTDNTVNGTPTDKAGSIVMYVNLIQNGLIVKSDIINPTTGFYQFLGLFFGQYEVQIASTRGVTGQAPPAQNLPGTYIYTGENIGAAAGNDGMVDGRILISISNGADEEEVNFGINGIPTSNDATGLTIANPGGVTQVQLPTLVISDPEENNINNINIQLIPNTTTMGTLYYDGIAVSSGQFIADYDSQLLTFDPVDGDVTMAFTYFTTDMAGVMSNISTVIQEFMSTTLPIELISFEATKHKDKILLKWSTAFELNNDYFTLEKSTDGRAFETFATVNSQHGTSNNVQRYEYSDDQIYGTTYYRLTQIDFDGQSTMSDIISILINSSPEIVIYPTLVSEVLYIEARGEDPSHKGYRYQIVNDQSKFIDNGIVRADKVQHDCNTLAAGIYYIIISDAQGRWLQTERVIKL